MRRFVLGWKMLGLERSLDSRIVTYADALVILCRRGKGEEALARMRELMWQAEADGQPLSFSRRPPAQWPDEAARNGEPWLTRHRS